MSRDARIILGLAAALVCATFIGVMAAADAVQSSMPSPSERIEIWVSTRPGEPLRASVGFDGRQRDDVVISLLKRDNVRPLSVFMWACGVAMSHRVSDLLGADQLTADAVIPNARASIIKSSESAVKSDITWMDSFRRLHGEAEALESAELQSDMRGRLNLLACYAGVLSAARTGAPLVYAVEVVGEPHDIERMATDPAVKSFEPAMVFRARVVVPPARRPAAFERGCINDDVLSLDPRLAYQRIVELASKR